MRERRGAARQKGEGGLKELAGALGMAFASISELIRKQRGTCPAHLIRLDGMASTKSSPVEICSALVDEDRMTKTVSKRDERGAKAAISKYQR